jgi:hypothetical protein
MAAGYPAAFFLVHSVRDISAINTSAPRCWRIMRWNGITNAR